MKKLLLISITFLFAFTANVFAQESIGVTAEVLADITWTTTDVAFGNVQQGSTAYVSADGGNNDDASSNASAPSAGSLSVIADAQAYTVEVSQSAILSDGNTESENTLQFTHTVFFGATNITDDVNGAGYSVTNGGDQSFDIGGELALPSAAGSYSTNSGNGQNLVFTISYTGL